MNMKRIARKVENKTRFFIKHMANPLGKLLTLMCPFIVILMHKGDYKSSKEFMYTLIIVLLTFAVAAVLRGLAEACNCSDNIPVPRKRYTVEKEGSVQVREDEVEEVILYMCDVEDYLERKGLL